MSYQQVDFSKTLSDDQVYETIMSNYSNLSKERISHQWNWMNSVYWAFNDHYKYMIVISLIEKTLQFYDQMNIQYTYDEYYSKSYLQIDTGLFRNIILFYLFLIRIVHSYHRSFELLY